MNALKGTTTAQLIVYVLTLLVATCASVTVDIWMKGWDMCVQISMSVWKIPVTKMQHVITLMAVSCVPATLDILVMEKVVLILMSA
jgi:hypothetical protein